MQAEGGMSVGAHDQAPQAAYLLRGELLDGWEFGNRYAYNQKRDRQIDAP